MKTPTLILTAMFLSASAIAQETANTAADGSASSPPSFEKLDTNSDGRITTAEAQADRTVAAKLSMIDKQGKGYITKEEYQAFVKREKNEKAKS